MTIEHDRFKRRLARRLAEAALRRSRPKVPSRTLRNNMAVYVARVPGIRRDVEGRVEIPHFWALYVHDGRGGFAKDTYMVWWRNPKRDPRLSGGKTPRRAKALRHLNREQWEAAVAERQAWIDAGGDPYNAPVIITKVIRRPTKPSLFFSNDAGGGMQGFSQDASRIAQVEFSSHIRKTLGDNLNIRDSATFYL